MVAVELQSMSPSPITLASFAFAFVLSTGHANAGEGNALYEAQAVVTGTGEPNREFGFRDCLGRVLIRVSGDQRVVGDERFSPMLARAGSYISDFRYHDRLEGIPIHDEQGTHDRPQDLTCIYAPSTIDTLLALLDRKPWLSPRPTIAVVLTVHDSRRSFILTRDGGESPYMIDSFMAAAASLAMSLALPDRDMLNRLSLAAGDLANLPLDSLGGATLAIASDQLAGSLLWSDEDRGWIANWRLARDGKIFSWQIRGVSFDDAFRNAILGAAQILSGNGAPQ
jgi:uncharacterized protein